MNTKLFVVFAALCAVLLSTQTASCEDADVQQPDELYILNPGSAFPYIVTNPDSPILRTDPRQVIRICIASQCNSVCRSWGFRIGRCNNQAVCVCSR